MSDGDYDDHEDGEGRRLRRGSSVEHASGARDSDTSEEAAKGLKNLTAKHKTVLGIHAQHRLSGLTDFELGVFAQGEAGHCWWKRSGECIGKGYLEDTGNRRRNPDTGRNQAVLRITDAGLEWLEHGDVEEEA